MNVLEVFLGFVTLWVVIIAGVVYLLHRRSTPGWRGAQQSCCLEVPCSTRCAEQHQQMRDRLSVQYDKVMAELVGAVTAGQEIQAALPSGRGTDPGAR